MSKKKILIISSRFPYPLEKGDKLRLYHQMKVLAQEYEIELVSITSDKPTSIDVEMLEKLCSKVTYFKLDLMSRIWSLIIGIFKKRPFQVSYFYNRAIHKKVDIIIKESNPDFIYCQLVRAAEYVKDQPIVKVIDFMDAFGWGMNKRAKNVGFVEGLFYSWEAKLLIRYEQLIFDKFDFHTIISVQDRGRMELAYRGSIKIVPNGVDIEFFTNSGKKDKEYEICFIGNMGYLPNVHAVQYISKKIMPSLLSSSPHIRLLIAGARPIAAIKKLDSKAIKVEGWMEDIRDAYNSSSIFVAPIFIGIGQQNKILEAMAMGLPCITSDEVNNSIGAVPGESILLANTSKEYVDTIEYLLNQPEKCKVLTEKARTFVMENYSWESQSMELFNIFTE